PAAAGSSPGVAGLGPILQALWDCPKPTLARVGGPARGGGLGLIGACDLAVADQTATFAFSEVRLGVAPAVVSVVTLPKLGVAAATELYLTAMPISADRAAALGLITRAVPAADLDRTVREYVQALQAAPPAALAATKHILRTVPTLPLPDALTAMTALSTELFQSPDAREGMTAFRERRLPRWAPAPAPTDH
ncbi:MAG TPA: enoyl-CoA hydratase-related protein, partial [Candidatus Dormibacteraeota bacterium]|nr:enoyl-CoA hydratase-related protein [Candidatus Dormibacteraeota bacterium]